MPIVASWANYHRCSIPHLTRHDFQKLSIIHIDIDFSYTKNVQIVSFCGV